MTFIFKKCNGSTNFLTHYIKAFIGVKIKNRIIGLYDNDSAAIAELENLKAITEFPSNIKIMKLPYINIAQNYPTIGPTDINYMDINGLACSIELFLGSDVLKDENGNFEPIRWKSYIDKIKKYQGEIQNKSLIQDRFKEKLKEHTKNNYEEMHILINNIINI